MEVKVLIDGKRNATFYSNKELLADIVKDLMYAIEKYFKTKRFQIISMQKNNNPYISL